MKKKIGISYTKTNFPYYWNWFTSEDLNDEIELVELSFEKNNIADISQCDGFVLTGGIDIDPALYEGSADYPNKPGSFQRERDVFEKKIFEYSQEHQLPLLGICRGFQLVNVLQGGKLIEDLGPLNGVHRKENDIDKEHVVETEKGTLLQEITGLSKGTINSAHHQGISPDALGLNLLVNAWSPHDGTIEGLEFRDKTGKAFMLCVQWHPERMKDKDLSPFSRKIKERFLEEIKKVQR